MIVVNRSRAHSFRNCGLFYTNLARDPDQSDYGASRIAR
jgi:hypothetical protein